MRSFACWAALGLVVTGWTSADVARSIDTGRDVGDGQVGYAAPYDPKKVSAMTFVAPTLAHPYYEVVVPMGDWDGGSSATVSRVRVNGIDIESFYVFVDGFSHVQGAWITRESATAENVVLVARALWHNGERTTVDVEISGMSDGSVTRTFTATAPGKGGGPEGWRRYQSFVLKETDGLDRQREPVEFSVAVRREDCLDLDRELRLFMVQPDSGLLNPVDIQTFNSKEFEGRPAGTSNENYLFHPSRSLEAIFLADVPAEREALYVLVYDNPGAQPRPVPKSDLTVTGPALGASVENRFYTVKLDERSGQIASFDLKGWTNKPVPKLTNSYSYAVHWNPDSFSDNGKWGHTFAWNPPDQTTVTARGPLLFRVTNRGRMPDRTPQVHASVTYSFYAGVPYVKVSTVTEVRDPLNASAIRNGEIVLDSHLVTHFVWEGADGELETVQTLHGPNFQDEWTTRVDQEVPWLAMTNELDGYGIGAAVESSIQFNPNRGEATTHRAAFYLYYHHMWQIPVTYFTRAWVYPFSDYQRGPILPVDEGSTYVEKAAYVPFFLREGKERYKAIEDVSRQMRHPLVQRWGR